MMFYKTVADFRLRLMENIMLRNSFHIIEMLSNVLRIQTELTSRFNSPLIIKQIQID